MLFLVLIHSLSGLIGNLLNPFIVNLLLARRYRILEPFFSWWTRLLLLNPLVTVPVLVVGAGSAIRRLVHLLVVELLVVLRIF